MASAELLLHPVRLRIAQAFLGDRALTTTQLRQELSDVPTATLYRHVAALVEGGVLQIAEERRVRGASERTYRLRAETASVGPEEARTMSVEEHRQAFMTFVAALLADFDRYLARDQVDLARDLVGYRQSGMHLTDEELLELIRDLGEVLAPRLALPPSPERTRRILTTILVPST
ncbi:helix-turn-helix domain-containing protein [Micromonospora sp. NPDC049301]|uniref:helix-turn-helix domain-containing protein n=1 Tax=Micromonospora sp. NPDC049301 TaxID=3155723 RepID=UPI0034378A5B